MKKIIFFLLFAAWAFCEDFRLSFLIGDVFIKRTRSDSEAEITRNDFQAGRTRRDKFGNLTRVEQHLYRPTNKGIRFVNINKRETSNNASEFSYGMIDATFNKALPDDISKWREWIEGIIEFHPKRVEIILSNGRPQDKDADRIKWEAIWEDNELKGPTFWIDRGGDNAFGYTKYSIDWKKILFSKETTFDIYDHNNTKVGELLLSLYLINNDGKELTKDDLKDIDFFDFLENIAWKMRLTSETLLNKPIDIIFTPDIVIEGIKKFAGLFLMRRLSFFKWLF